ncbi:MAG: hypothetical protein EXR93_11630 [Gemmatimonadetes bacterium]|nr:hypothetical protein [Gemmatimonadota bacterium]
MMSSSLRRAVQSLVALAFVVGFGACAEMLPKKNRSSEQVSKLHEGSKYQVIVTVAGGDSRAELRQSSMVRAKLAEGGWQALRRSGRWATEAEAIADICPAGESVSVDGVLFIYYNQLSLVDCRTRTPAITIQGGDDLGIDGMANRLISYLRTGKGGGGR